MIPVLFYFVFNRIACKRLSRRLITRAQTTELWFFHWKKKSHLCFCSHEKQASKKRFFVISALVPASEFLSWVPALILDYEVSDNISPFFHWLLFLMVCYHSNRNSKIVRLLMALSLGSQHTAFWDCERDKTFSLLSLCPMTTVHGIFSDRVSHKVLMDSQRQWKDFVLFWSPLGPSFLTGRREYPKLTNNQWFLRGALSIHGGYLSSKFFFFNQ